VAAVARRPDHLDVFWAADDGAIWTNWWNAQANGGRWNTPFPITNRQVVPPGAAVAAVARTPDHLDIFWADNDGAIGTNWWDAHDPNGGWNKHPAFRISDPNVVPPGAGVAAVARHPDHLDVFWADNGGAIGTNWWDGNDPNGSWNKHPAFRISDPNVVPPGARVAAVARRPEQLDVFWADNGGAIWTNWWDGNDPNGGWNKHPAFRITQLNVVPPGAGVAAVSRYPDHLDVFWADNGGAIGTTWWNGTDPNGGWDKHPAFRITNPNVVPPGAAVAAVARHPDHLAVFWAGNNGAVQTNWWDAQDPYGGWDQHPTVDMTPRKAVPLGAGVATVARYPDQYKDPSQRLSVKVQKIDIRSSTAVVDISLE
jgi:hypothetical protein